MTPPTLTAIEIKAFVPARDFARSMAFYQALGFTRASEGGGIGYFHCGHAAFLLQDFYVKESADHLQIHLLVDDVEAWHARAREVAGSFGVGISEPQDQPWAMRDFTMFDPSGVLWRIAQNLTRADASDRCAASD